MQTRKIARRFTITIAVMLCTIAVAPTPSAQVLTGTYACRDTGNQGPDWHFTSENISFGQWVRAKTSFPPQNGTGANISQAFVGYDRGAKRWNIVVINDDGSYYTRYSTSPQLNGSQWKDLNPADGGTAVITLPNSKQYVFDFHGAPKGGKIEHDRVVCTKGSS
jgi:hypothetical protein